MDTKTASVHVKCPHCGNKFSPETAIEHDLKLRLEREFEKKMDEHAKAVEQRVKRHEEEKFLSRLKALEADREEKASRLVILEEQSLAFEEREQRLHTREEQIDIEMRRKFLEREKVLREEAERKARTKAEMEMKEQMVEIAHIRETMDLTMRKAVLEETERAREEERMKAAELQKKLDDTTRLVHEMQRKSAQGSMQSQGEVQELAIEEFLSNTFRRDEIAEITKGKRGGDCLHVVKDALGNTAGKILYESKRTKNFGGDWTMKLKEDMRLTQADIGVIVTQALPGEMTRFGLYEGVWVCTFSEFKALAHLFRDSLNRIGEVRAINENKGEKMQMLYDYLTSVEFRQKLEAIVEAFRQMQDDLNRERLMMQSQWSKREKNIYKVMENTVSLYGDVRGIAGTAVKEIESLEINEVKALTTL